MGLKTPYYIRHKETFVLGRGVSLSSHLPARLETELETVTCPNQI